MPKINAARLLADLRELRTFGAAPDHPRGVIRPTYSAADMSARRWKTVLLLAETSHKRSNSPEALAKTYACKPNPPI